MPTNLWRDVYTHLEPVVGLSVFRLCRNLVKPSQKHSTNTLLKKEQGHTFPVVCEYYVQGSVHRLEAIGALLYNSRIRNRPH